MTIFDDTRRDQGSLVTFPATRGCTNCIKFRKTVDH